MSFEIIFVFALLVVAFVLFATDYVSFDVAAMILLFSLLVTGILTFEEGLSGISMLSAKHQVSSLEITLFHFSLGDQGSGH